MSLCLVSATHATDDELAKIEFLLSAVGSSGCIFIRNGKEHAAEDAEEHLRMKYRRGKKWATNAELFIDRIATKSSFSGKLYRIHCSAHEPQLTADWLRKRLVEYVRE